MKLNVFYFSFFLTSFVFSQTGIITDKRDGKNYKTVIIAKRTWMAENLNAAKFRNGDSIPQAKTVEEWVNAGLNKQPAWCYYNNDPANGKLYGKLYNWYAVIDSRGLAPEGWHLPSYDELYDMLFPYGGQSSANPYLKSKSGWSIESYSGLSQNGNNKSGFSVLPGGKRTFQEDKGSYRKPAIYQGKGDGAYFWLSPGPQNTNPSFFDITLPNRTSISSFISVDYLGYGYSVRCIKD
jgi:uncharacterized protein (TIGR02145 family)